MSRPDEREAKVDAATMVCRDHEIHGCQECMVDDFHAWLDDRRWRNERIKQERRAMTIEERYDLGGEA